MEEMNVDRMVEDQYEESLGGLRQLVEFAHAISSTLQDKSTTSSQKYYASIALSKIVSHGITLLRILPAELSLSASSGAERWDISSIACVVRAIIETNDALAYVCDSSESGEMTLLRIHVWELHDKERRLKVLRAIGSSAPEVQEIERFAEELRKKIQASETFSSLHKSNHVRIAKGNSPDFLVPLEKRCERAGISYQYYLSARIFLSSYVHSHPFALHQLIEFRAGNANSLRLISLPVRYANAFLAKAIELMQSLFEEEVPSPEAGLEKLVLIWAGIAKEGLHAMSDRGDR